MHTWTVLRGDFHHNQLPRSGTGLACASVIFLLVATHALIFILLIGRPKIIDAMSTCLFCLRECQEATDEHVFPAALGGVLTVNGGSCTECNNGFSRLEQALAGELAPVRLLLQIPDRYKQVPQVEATAKTEQRDYDARVMGDGTVRARRLVEEVKRDDGTREFVHRFLTDRQKEKLRREAEEKGRELLETGPGEPVQAEIHIGGELRIIGSDEGLRTAAKIAYVGLAFRMGERMANKPGVR
jgi:hypothetical protein